MFNKLALTVTAPAYAAHGGISGTGNIIGWDDSLSLLLITAHICCRGWTGGAVRAAAAKPAPPW